MKNLVLAAALMLAATATYAEDVVVVNKDCANDPKKAMTMKCSFSLTAISPTEQMYAANPNLKDYLVGGMLPAYHLVAERPA